MSTLPKIKARTFLKYTTQELRDKLKGDFIVVFDDGQEEVTNERMLCYSSIAWDMLRAFPKAPILAKHFVRGVLKNKVLPAQAHSQLLTSIWYDVFDCYQAEYANNLPDLVEQLSRSFYKTANEYFNQGTRMTKWAGSLDITDFIKVADLPDLQEALAKAPPTEQGIEAANQYVLKTIMGDERLVDNPLALAVRSGISRVGQTLQILGRIGMVADIDGAVFSTPVNTNYLTGVRTLYESMIESRLASQALKNTETPLKNSEYFSRRQQLITMNTRTLHLCDCGSQKYISWLVRDQRFTGDKKVGESDLKTIAGKYFLDETTGKVRPIRINDTHLIGKTIKIRSLLAGCNHPDPSGVCVVCFGESGIGMPKYTNIGHACAVSMFAVIGQNLLSTKHMIGSAGIEAVFLSPHEAKYLKTDKEGIHYYLNPRLKSQDAVTLVLPGKQALGIPGIQSVEDVYDLNVARTSAFDVIGITVSDKFGDISTSLSVSNANRYASLSHEAMDHIKRNGIDFVSKDNIYRLDMSKWDYSKPLLSLPRTQYSMSDHQRQIQDMLEITKEDMRKRTSKVSIPDMLVEFHDLVNSRLAVNLAVLDIVLYSSLVVDGDNGNYALPKGYTGMDVSAMSTILERRSAAATFAFEGHRRFLTDPRTYLNTNTFDHPFDVVIMPTILNPT